MHWRGRAKTPTIPWWLRAFSRPTSARVHPGHLYWNIISGWKFITFVAFHMLVLLEMDISGLYLAILRVSFRAALLPTERIFSGLVLRNLLQNLNGAFSERKKRKSPVARKKNKTLWRKREGNWFPFFWNILRSCRSWKLSGKVSKVSVKNDVNSPAQR